MLCRWINYHLAWGCVVYRVTGSISGLLGSFRVAEVAMRYSDFVPRFYNLTKSLGFEAGKIMPSRAFCSDESQGYPIILIAKHFGTFPFNHGRVGGVVSIDRHGPHAHHGQDLVIIHASHVGYDPESATYGTYRRIQTAEHDFTVSCGKICGTLDWYSHEYQFARDNIFVLRENDDLHIVIDNQLLHTERPEGLILRLDRLVEKDVANELQPLRNLSTSKVFRISQSLQEKLGQLSLSEGELHPLKDWFTPDLFFFRKASDDHMDRNLIDAMPLIVASKWPALTAAQVNTQVEFDRAFRSILQEPEYAGKNLLFISGLHIDISPQPGQLFPLTKFIPWAACHLRKDGSHETWEQQELYERIQAQPKENPDQVDLEQAIRTMKNLEEIKLPV